MFYTVLLVLIIAGTLYAALRTDLPWKGARLIILLGLRLLLLACVAAFMLDLRLPRNYASEKVELMVVADRSASISDEGGKDRCRGYRGSKESGGERELAVPGI